eukprot:766286-Hanusia_phi.AAC.4
MSPRTELALKASHGKAKVILIIRLQITCLTIPQAQISSEDFYHPQAIREVQEAVVQHEGSKPVSKITIGSWAADHPKPALSMEVC